MEVYVGAALTRYRVVAYVVGTVLLVLVAVAMPLKYLADRPTAVAVVGPIHGFLYIVYLIVTFDLSMRQRWPLTRTLLLCLAGTVPVLTFVAERWVTRQVREPAKVT
jgi:integral membrane protein